jgi:hypothetical protein
MAPQVLAALISGGMSLLGGGLSGIGGAKAAKEDREFQQRESALDRELRRKESERAANMSGIGMLASMRSNAMQKTAHQKFKDSMYKAATMGRAV